MFHVNDATETIDMTGQGIFSLIDGAERAHLSGSSKRASAAGNISSTALVFWYASDLS